MQRAVSEWSALNPEQKKAYGEAYRAAHPEAVAGHDGGGDGCVPMPKSPKPLQI